MGLRTIDIVRGRGWEQLESDGTVSFVQGMEEELDAIWPWVRVNWRACSGTLKCHGSMSIPEGEGASR